MVSIPVKWARRISEQLKRYQLSVKRLKDQDANEADTVILVADILSDLFGYDKRDNLTTEYAVRGRFVDIALVEDRKPFAFIEVKAVGTDLKEQHLRQVVDYAANHGVEWVILTNSNIWQVYKVIFGQPIESELVESFKLLALNPRSKEDVARLYALSIDGFKRGVLKDQHKQKQIVNRFVIGGILRMPPALQLVRKELRKLDPTLKITEQDILQVLEKEVLKRELLEDPQAKVAQKVLQRLQRKKQRPNKAKQAVVQSDTDSEG